MIALEENGDEILNAFTVLTDRLRPDDRKGNREKFVKLGGVGILCSSITKYCDYAQWMSVGLNALHNLVSTSSTQGAEQDELRKTIFKQVSESGVLESIVECCKAHYSDVACSKVSFPLSFP